MTESTMIDAFSKLGASALLGVILYVVLIRVGAAIVSAITKLGDRLDVNTTAIAVNTEAVARVEAKIDFQLMIERERDHRERSTPLEVPVPITPAPRPRTPAPGVFVDRPADRGRGGDGTGGQR